MKSKYTQEQLDILIRSLNSDNFNPDETMGLLSSDELREKYLRVMSMAEDEEREFTDEDMELFDTFDDTILEDCATQIAIDQFPQLARIEDTNKRAQLATFIIDHPEEYDDQLTDDVILDLIITTEDLEYINKWIQVIETLQGVGKQKYSPEFLNGLYVAYEKIEQKQFEAEIKQAQEEGYKPLYDTYDELDPSNERYVPPEQKAYEDFSGFYDEGKSTVIPFKKLPEDAHPYTISEDEKFAARIYEGAKPWGNAAAEDANSYKTLNTIMFPGIENEMTRVFDDYQVLNPTVFYQTKELLKIYRDLLSAMYKHGQEMTKPYEVRRVDRTQSFDEILARKELVSSFSTTLNYFPKEFSKAHISLVEAKVEPGALCFNFEKILQDTYSHKPEREVLVGPFSPVEIVDVVPRDKLNIYEKEVTDYTGNPAEQKYIMVIKPVPKPEPLTKEERADKKEKMKFVMDEDNRDRVATFVARLNSMGAFKISKEHALDIIPQEELDFYIKWKSSIQDIVKYDLRENILQIDKKMEKFKEAHSQEQEPKEQEEVKIIEAKKDDLREKSTEEVESEEPKTVAQQMIEEYKSKYGPDAHEDPSDLHIEVVPDTTHHISKKELTDLAVTRGLKKVNMAISSFKAKVAGLFGKKQDSQNQDTPEK